MRTRIIVMVLALTLALVAVGCGGSGGAGGGSSSDVRPGLVLDVGGLGDDGFNDSAYAGLKRAEKDFGVKGDYLESTAPDGLHRQPHPARRERVRPRDRRGLPHDRGPHQVSKQFPDTQFAIVDSVVETPNTMDLVFREQEGSYLAGIVAGLMTQEKTAVHQPRRQGGWFPRRPDGAVDRQVRGRLRGRRQIRVPRLQGARPVRRRSTRKRSTTRPRARRSACSR